MLTVSNLEFIQEKSIKKTLGQFQEAFQIDVASDVTVRVLQWVPKSVELTKVSHDPDAARRHQTN